MTEELGSLDAHIVDGKVVVTRADKRVAVADELLELMTSERHGDFTVGEYTYRYVGNYVGRLVVVKASIYERVEEAPAMTEPGCSHPDCKLEHPHAGPAILNIDPPFLPWTSTPLNIDPPFLP